MNHFSRVLAVLLLYVSAGNAVAQNDSVMRAHFINVGQGAAALLEFPCGVVMIDAGAQDDEYQTKLMDYLARFFKRRKDLNNTIDLVMVTHPHVDHNQALMQLAQTYRVDRYIDNGMRTGSGKTNQKWLQDNAAGADILYENITFEKVTKNGSKKGLTDSIIDPINCPTGNPAIVMYSGQFINQPDDWSKTAFGNANNHSLVVKVTFGKSSLLFTGDLETEGIETILGYYSGTKSLDADVLLVGHHGAKNATTEEYLQTVTPNIAVISCGPWDYGKNDGSGFNTYSYGHPRISTLNMLDYYIPGRRSETITVQAAEGARDFRPYIVDKKIYATPWDDHIVVRADLKGKYTVTTTD